MTGLLDLFVCNATVSVVYNVPSFLELQVELCQDGDQLGASIYPRALRQSPAYNIGYRIIGSLLCVSLLPFLLIAALTTRIICFVRKSSQASEHTGSSRNERDGSINGRRRQRRRELLVTKLLLLLSGKFLLTHSLPLVLNVWETALFARGAQSILAFDYVTDTSNLIVVLSSATNFLVYCSWKLPKLDAHKGGWRRRR